MQEQQQSGNKVKSITLKIKFDPLSRMAGMKSNLRDTNTTTHTSRGLIDGIKHGPNKLTGQVITNQSTTGGGSTTIGIGTSSATSTGANDRGGALPALV